MEWINADEAAQLSGRCRKNIYVWARKGYVRSKVEKTQPWQKVGMRLFHSEDVAHIAELVRQGVRTDLKPLESYETTGYSDEYAFTDAQLEIARRVYG